MKTDQILKFIISACFLLLFTNTSIAQEFNWAKNFGSTLNDRGEAIVMDNMGNVYTIGGFSDTCNFDLNETNEKLVSFGGFDVFVSKADAKGNLLWVKQLGGKGSDIGYSIIIDSSNNVFIAGIFSDTADFDPGMGVFELISSGNSNAFITKLDNDGNFLWAKQFSGTGFVTLTNIKIADSQYIYAAGSFSQTADFDPSTTTVSLSSSGNFDAFVTKLSKDGDFIWAKCYGGTDNDNCNDLEIDNSGNVLLSGIFNGTVDFDPNNGTESLTSNGGTDGYVNKLNSDGNFIWVKRIVGSANGDNITAIELDNSGNIYCSGYYAGNNDFDPGSNQFSLTPTSVEEAYITKLNANGDFQWVVTFEGSASGFSLPVDMKLDENGNIYNVGIFNETVDFDFSGNTNELSSPVGNDIFICKLDNSGNFVWAKQIGEPNNIENPNNLMVYGATGIYITGGFRNTVDFNTESGVNNLTSVGADDAFILKMCSNTTETVAVDACNNYTSPSGKYNWTTGGSYLDTIINTSGCDSIITINLTVNTVDASVTNNEPILIANNANASYVWVDCDNNFTAIPNATSSSFEVTESGNYAVEVTENGCTLRSDCIEVILVSSIDLVESYLFNVYPNPASEYIFVETSKAVTITIYNAIGEIAFEKDVEVGKTLISTSDFATGVYFIKASENNIQHTTRFIISR